MKRLTMQGRKFSVSPESSLTWRPSISLPQASLNISTGITRTRFMTLSSVIIFLTLSKRKTKENISFSSSWKFLWDGKHLCTEGRAAERDVETGLEVSDETKIHGPGACKPLQWTEPQRSEKNEGLLSGSSASFKHSESICVQSRSWILLKANLVFVLGLVLYHKYV